MLKLRMQILEQGNVISKEVLAFMNQTIDVMAVRFPELPMEKAEMFTTHLAMAMERMRAGNEVDGLDDSMWEEITACAEFGAAAAFLDEIIAYAPVEMPESERRFLLLHICSMLQQ